ncbi:recombinase family protein [Rhizobium ruizarguesonis]|uniref:Recombinase family protein n=1 Tax=Rhizobium ruizarguesonis TaxID=2081791 RepID=A0AB38HQS4_9HYPH|nr:recombinase family protein [Rhizobium ruizarguesonis]
MITRFNRFARSLIHERISSGGAAAKVNDVRFGRPPTLSAQPIALARKLIDDGQTPRTVAKVRKVHPVSLYRSLDGERSDHV